MMLFLLNFDMSLFNFIFISRNFFIFLFLFIFELLQLLL